jgi:hypothetical protein
LLSTDAPKLRRRDPVARDESAELCKPQPGQRAMIFSLILSPMSGLLSSATISLKLAPGGIVIGA